MAQRAQQQQTPRSRQQAPLDTLQGMVNAVLLETGKALRSANRKGTKTIGYNNERLQAFVPSAVNNFHAALDELESDIVQAKAVLNRDLRELRARQYAIDHPSTVALEERTAVELPLDITNGTSKMESTVEVKVEDDSNQKTDTALNEISTLKVEESSVPQSPSVPIEIETHESLEKEKLAAGIQAKPEAEDILKGDLPVTEQPAGLAVETFNIPPPPTLGDTSAISAVQDMNFESMFDGGATSTDTDINFDDLDFEGGETSGHIQDFDSTGEDHDLVRFGDQVTSNHEEANTMLEGLDSFGDTSGGGQFSLPALPEIDIDFNGGTQAETSRGGDFDMSGADLDMTMDMAANESTFDDLLDVIDFGNGGDDVEGDMMEHGEYDNAFFGLE